jgi:Cupin domain.
MHPDTREFYAVMEGEVRFVLEGQAEPIAATRGSIVNIPRRTAYSAEVIGTAPALWVTANQQNFKTLYPVSDPRPAQMPGFSVMKVGLNVTPGAYAGNNKPHFNLFERRKIRSSTARTSCRTTTCGRRRSGATRRTCRRTIRTTRDTSTWNRRVVDRARRTDPPQHRDHRRLHVERRRRRICAAVDLARDAFRRSWAVVPAGDQHVPVHEPARAAAVRRG